jgi:hypothetical protein
MGCSTLLLVSTSNQRRRAAFLQQYCIILEDLRSNISPISEENVLTASDRTLHKIHTFIEAQQEGLKMKALFRHAEMNALLKDCRNGLQDAFNVFKVHMQFRLIQRLI